jgi:RNA polymerase sigma-70 factor (ECF subfamily)
MPTVRTVNGDHSLEPDIADQIVDGMTLWDAMQQLSRQHREVVRLLFFDGLSNSQVADRLGIPEGTVKSSRHYALKYLRTLLSDGDQPI